VEAVSRKDSCRPVELPDGRVIRVRGEKPMDAEGAAWLAEVVAAVERMMADEDDPGQTKDAPR